MLCPLLALGFLLFRVSALTAPRVVKQLYIREFSSCSDGAELPFVILNTRLDLIGRGRMALNAVGAARWALQAPDRMFGRLYKCQSFTDLESCEYNSRVTLKDPLVNLNAKNRTWTSVVQSVRPPLKFPLKKGRYEMKNATLDIEVGGLLTEIPDLESFYWQVKMEMFLKNTRQFCVLLGAEITSITKPSC